MVTAIVANGHALRKKTEALSASCLAVSLLLRSFAELLVKYDVTVHGNIQGEGAFALSIPEPAHVGLAQGCVEGASQLLLQSLTILSEQYPNDVQLTIEKTE